MMTTKFFRSAGMVVFGAVLLLSCSDTNVPGVNPDPTNQRTIDKEPPNRVMDQPSVADFNAACDDLTRYLSEAELFQRPGDPIVIEIAPMEDKAGQGLDLTIYLHTIREKLMNMGHGRIVFRDEQIRDHIVDERIAQSEAPIRMRKQESKQITGRRRRSQSGSYKGPGGTGTPIATDEVHQYQVEKEQDTEVSGKLADIDYYLTGFVYRQDERSAGSFRRGFRHYRFQFRLVSTNGIMVWEKAYSLKREGALRD